MKNQKQILAKLMALDNEQVDQKLVVFADGIEKRIKESKTNEERLEELELLKEFVYKAPKQTIAITQYVLANPLQSKSNYWGDVELPGKEQDEVVMKSLDLLNELRYISSDSVFEILVKIFDGDNKLYKNKVLEIAKNFAKYDFNVLTKSKIGYGAQRKILDIVSGWSTDKQFQRLDFIEVVAKCLLDSSVEGSTATAVDTLTMHFGVVQPTEFLKKIRNDMLAILFKVYKLTRNDTERIKILHVLDEATRGPSNIAYSDDVLNMLVDTHKKLLSFYRKIIFDKKGAIISLSIAEEIEKRLYWLNKSNNFAVSASKKLRKDILSHSKYKFFRMFMGNDFSYGDDEEYISQDLSKLPSKITDKNLKKWTMDLNLVADQIEVIGEWKFLNFKNFLRQFAQKKPSLAKRILIDACTENKSLKKFTASFLDGFRDGGQVKVWDSVVNVIVDLQEPTLVSAIPFSLNYDSEVDLDSVIRDEDLEILKEITEEKKRFLFLKEQGGNYVLHYALMNALLRNFKRKPKLIEGLVVKELDRVEYTNAHVQALTLADLKNWLDFSQLNVDTKEKLNDWLVRLPDLDWHTQAILLNLGKNDLKLILDVFWKRIKREIENKENNKSIVDRDHYDAVPYHMNDKLVNRIGDDPQYIELISAWLNYTTTEWSLYNWGIGEFLSRIGTSTRAVIMSLIEKGNDDSLLKASHIMHRTEENNDYDLCLEIVKRTDNEDILSRVESILYSTGVVTGEYGIAEAYENKAKNLAAYLSDGNERVRKFVEKLRGHLLASSQAERKRTDESKHLRKKEFEG